MDREITSLLEQKLDKINELLKVTKSISDIIKKEDIEELLKLFKDRQQLMDDIDHIDGKLLTFFKDDKNALVKHINSDGQLKAINDSVLSLVTRIKALDDANLEGVKNLFAKLKEDIAAFRQTETALKGYGLLGTSNRDGAFIDTKK